MLRDDYHFMTDYVFKFHKYIYITGWFHHPTDNLSDIAVHRINSVHYSSETQKANPTVEPTIGPNKGFEVVVLRCTDAEIPEDAAIEFITESGKRVSATILELASDRASHDRAAVLSRQFIETVNGMEGATLLDIGGRARSQVDRSRDFPNASVTVLDILDDENVDVVGDAHELSALFPPDSFDAVQSVSVFEHLMMPWKVVVEMNRVLKTGGIGFVATHQTIGMHDLPWDFWRFSDTAWDALFNEATGFEIVDRALSSEQFIVPFVYRPSGPYPERSAGYESSAVTFRKTGPCRVDWPVKLGEISDTMYPSS